MKFVIKVSRNFRNTLKLSVGKKDYMEKDGLIAKIMEKLSMQMPDVLLKYLSHNKTGEEDSKIKLNLCFGEVPRVMLHKVWETSSMLESASIPDAVVIVFMKLENINEVNFDLIPEEELDGLLNNPELVATTDREGNECKAFFEMAFADLEMRDPPPLIKCKANVTTTFKCTVRVTGKRKDREEE